MDVPQVGLLFATDAKGQTLYEKMAEGKLLLGPRPGKMKRKRPGILPYTGSLPQYTRHYTYQKYAAGY